MSTSHPVDTNITSSAQNVRTDLACIDGAYGHNNWRRLINMGVFTPSWRSELHAQGGPGYSLLHAFRYSSKVMMLTVGAGFFTFLVLITMTLSDYISRNWVCGKTQKGRTADLSTTLRSGRDDKSSYATLCHLDRSVA